MCPQTNIGISSRIFFVGKCFMRNISMLGRMVQRQVSLIYGLNNCFVILVCDAITHFTFFKVIYLYIYLYYFRFKLIPLLFLERLFSMCHQCSQPYYWKFCEMRQTLDVMQIIMLMYILVEGFGYVTVPDIIFLIIAFNGYHWPFSCSGCSWLLI